MSASPQNGKTNALVRQMMNTTAQGVVESSTETHDRRVLRNVSTNSSKTHGEGNTDDMEAIYRQCIFYGFDGGWFDWGWLG